MCEPPSPPSGERCLSREVEEVVGLATAADAERRELRARVSELEGHEAAAATVLPSRAEGSSAGRCWRTDALHPLASISH